MSVFSEIYGVYFRITAALLSRMQVTEREITDYISAHGFRDSVLFLPQKLIPQNDKSDWGLLRRLPDGLLESVLYEPPRNPLTLVQKRWLRALLDDPRLQLFLTAETADALRARLRDVKPLWPAAFFRYTDRFSDGDPYSDPEYQRRFRVLLAAMRANEAVFVRYITAKGETHSLRCLPLRLEYSPKNDKFRLYCTRISYGHFNGNGIINLGRITELSRIRGAFPEQPDMTRFFAKRRCKEPVTVRVTERRNATERFLLEFAAYEKTASIDPETGEVTVQLWYDRHDETELLIQLLSFGPVLEILSPPEFRTQAAQRIAAQYALNCSHLQKN